MDITSFSYCVFVGISLLIYWKIPAKYQWAVLLADSLLFYFINAAAYTFIYMIISVVSVFFATWIFEIPCSTFIKKVFLFSALVTNIGILGVLKYSNLVIVTINRIGRQSIPLVSLVAPLAISYYTLQLVAYLLNCYWGVTSREKNILKLLLFTSFFPLMVSGPISDYNKLGMQLFQEHRFDYERVISGLRRAAWGVAKKVIVADRVMLFVNYLFDDPDFYSGIWVIIAALGFVVVLYFDFSGCMDIVIGVSKCFGIILEENFNSPFLSRTVQEFWQRWHITLGKWLKSFVMYPILKSAAFVKMASTCRKRFGKNGKKIPTYIAMLAVWLLMGLWHGNSWKYIVGEGLWFWIIIVCGQVFKPLFKETKKALHIYDDNIIWQAFQVIRTIILFAIGNIFFHATSFSQAIYMISRIPVPTGLYEPARQLKIATWQSLGGYPAFIPICIIGILQIYCDIKTYKGSSAQLTISKMPIILRWILYYLFFIMVISGNSGTVSFIYFDF